MSPAWRSLLFVAAVDEARIGKAGQRGADAVILDVEDAVAPERKAAARDGLPHALAMLEAQGVPGVVRINGPWLEAVADLTVAVRAGAAAIMVPKASSPGRMEVLAAMVREAAQGHGPGLIALIEDPRGLARADAIAEVEGVVGLALGSEDFGLAMGAPPTPTLLEELCRRLARAAAISGRMALGLPISIATLDDDAGWAAAVAQARAVGLTGALCIHPRQVAAVNAGFAPTEAEVAQARAVVSAWRAAGGRGVLQAAGRMIDAPVAAAAERLLAQAARRAG